MKSVEEQLQYAQDRVATAQIPFSLVARASRRKALVEAGLAAAVCGALAWLLAIDRMPDPRVGTSPWTEKQLLAYNGSLR